MSRRFNFYLLEYTWRHIFRSGFKNIFLTLVMTLLVALLGSTFFLANAMKLEYAKKIQARPDIVVTETKAMRETLIQENKATDILAINGVNMAVPRVYGSYAFTKADVLFHIIGVDEFETYTDKNLNRLLEKYTLKENSMLISSRLQTLLTKNYYKNYFNFILSDGNIEKVPIAGTFQSEEVFLNPYTIVMSKHLAQKIFNYKNTMATDIAVMVANKDEIAYIAAKIAQKFPNAKVEVKEDLRVAYENTYNFKSGFFLTIFVISFFTYFIIIYDRVSGMSSEERKEIGILKAIGWRVSDILNARLYEGLLISMSAYIGGIIIAFIYVYGLNAPLLKYLFIQNSSLLHEYSLFMSVNYETLAILFFLSVPLYVAATIIPSWRMATLEADEVMR